MASTCCTNSQYVTLIPRGLHYIACDMIRQQLQQSGYDVQVKLIGETIQKEKDDVSYIRGLLNKKKQEEEETKRLASEAKATATAAATATETTNKCSGHNNNKEKTGKPPLQQHHYHHHDSSSSSCNNQNSTTNDHPPEKRRDKKAKIHESACRGGLPVGSLFGTVGDYGHKKHVSFGYYQTKQQIWSCTGQVSGFVWLKITTSASPEFISNRVRCMGPLLALVNTFQHNNDENDTNAKQPQPQPQQQNLESQSLEEAVRYVDQVMNYNEQKDDDDNNNRNNSHLFQAALDLWYRHVQASWPFLRNTREEQLETLRNKLCGQIPLRYRLSCLRNDSERFQYTRQQLLSRVADIIIPPVPEGEEEEENDNNNNNNNNQTTNYNGDNNNNNNGHRRRRYNSFWQVDLSDYDLEVVLLMNSTSLVLGLSLRPYQLLGCKSFSSGNIPPDVTHPYLSGTILSGLTRLRPTTANILLHLAEIQLGDVVLDPCAGIGTIPIEVTFLEDGGRRRRRRSSTTAAAADAIGLGGDLVLTPDKLGPIAAQYTQMAKADTTTTTASKKNKADSGCANVVAWDATNLPLRSESVDVIVSDLPFGQQCSSSNQLAVLLPLIISEMARVLRRGVGRMVLLCGSYMPLLECFVEMNHPNRHHHRQNTGHNNDSSICSSSHTATREKAKAADSLNVWELPCSSVFPVNIGGIVAWVIQVRRGPGSYDSRSPHNLEKLRRWVRKITQKRERIARLQEIEKMAEAIEEGTNNNKTCSKKKKKKIRLQS